MVAVVSARRAVSVTVIAAAALFGLTGCGTDHGQAKALTACHKFASANGGGLDPADLTAKLTVAAQWAAKASKQSPQWDELEASIGQFVSASSVATPSAATQSALVDARKVIDNSCEIAARGY